MDKTKPKKAMLVKFPVPCPVCNALIGKQCFMPGLLGQTHPERQRLIALHRQSDKH